MQANNKNIILDTQPIYRRWHWDSEERSSGHVGKVSMSLRHHEHPRSSPTKFFNNSNTKIFESVLPTTTTSTLTHWVTHILVSDLTIIGTDNGLSPGRRQAIIWTNTGILLIRTLGIHFSEILSEIHTSSFKKMHFKTSSPKWRPFCLGLNVLSFNDNYKGCWGPWHLQEQ